jgi:AcrR family transcriptional regulator
MADLTQNKKSYHHGNLKEACLGEGLRFVRQGNTQFSLRDLARRAGVSHQAPYHHFGSRGLLLGALAMEGFERFREQLQKARLEGGDSRRVIKQMMRAYLDFAMNHPEHYHLMFSSPDVEFPVKDTKTETVGAGSFHELVLAVQQLQEEKRLSSKDPIGQATTLWAWVHGVATLIIRDRLDFVGIEKPLAKAAFDKLYKPIEKLFEKESR